MTAQQNVNTARGKKNRALGYQKDKLRFRKARKTLESMVKLVAANF
jgi:hypothetical protein